SLALVFTYSQESSALTIYVPIASKTFSVSISMYIVLRSLAL
ncbi:21658_t:CDS:1, partial [Racocetra persica]